MGDARAGNIAGGGFFGDDLPPVVAAPQGVAAAVVGAALHDRITAGRGRYAPLRREGLL